MPRVLVLPGDGIGPEVTAEAAAVLRQVAPDVQLEERLIGGCAIDAEGAPLSDATVALAKECGLVLLGAVGGPKWDPLAPDKRPERGLLRIRKELGLYANLRPATVFKALADASPLRRECVEGVDLVVVRELTGGIYYGEPRGRDDKNGVRRARNTEVYDEHEVARIARVAFRLAQNRKRLVTNIHKANVLEVCAFWNEIVAEVAPEFPDVAARAPAGGLRGDGPAARRAEVRRAAVPEHVRRHPLRRGRHDHRVAGHAAVGQPRRRRPRPVRADPRQRAGHRGAGQGEPARGDPVRRDAARERARAARWKRRACAARSRS